MITTLDKQLPEVFDLPIIDYFEMKVYCKGYFRKPNEDDIKRLVSKDLNPYAIFEPAEPHGWKVFFYSKEAVEEIIQQARPIV